MPTEEIWLTEDTYVAAGNLVRDEDSDFENISQVAQEGIRRLTEKED